MADDDSSELSSISSLSAPPSEDESDIQLERREGILKFFHKVDQNPELAAREATPPRPKREPSPPHEHVLADNPDFAVCECPFLRGQFNIDAKEHACKRVVPRVYSQN